jgi:hypothetical protein
MRGSIQVTNVKPKDYFKNLDAVYINLDAATERREAIENSFSNIFRSLTRVVPIDFKDKFAVGVDTKLRLMDALQNYDEKGYFKRSNQYKIEDIEDFKHRKNDCKYVNEVWTPEQYAAQESLSQTYKQILKDFLASELDRIMVFEDDARARDFMDDKIDIPDDAEILAWGGATSSVQTDARHFMNEQPFHFLRVSGKRTAWYCTAYEFTRTGAAKLLEDFNSVPAYTTDTIIRYTLDRATAYRLSPMGFVQGDSSYLAREGIRMPLTRDEAKTYDFRNVIEHKAKLQASAN